jgi:hypothetical protein
MPFTFRASPFENDAPFSCSSKNSRGPFFSGLGAVVICMTASLFFV